MTPHTGGAARGSVGTAVITGGASGIGLATARRLHTAGMHVLIADVDQVAVTRAARDVGCESIQLDVTDLGAWKRLRDHLDRRRSPLEALVLNAGRAGGPADIMDVEVDDYRAMWALNVDGVVFGLRTLGPALCVHGRGTITITCSLAGLTGIPFDPVYAMTKHALIGLVRSSGPRLAAAGVRLQAVCPGLTRTPLLGDAEANLTQVGFTLLDPDDVASVIADCVEGRQRDDVIVCQPGCPASAYRFAGVPGPGGRAAPPLPADLYLGRRAAQQ